VTQITTARYGLDSRQHMRQYPTSAYHPGRSGVVHLGDEGHQFLVSLRSINMYLNDCFRGDKTGLQLENTVSGMGSVRQEYRPQTS
jgi:hypothetical protein